VRIVWPILIAFLSVSPTELELGLWVIAAMIIQLFHRMGYSLFHLSSVTRLGVAVWFVRVCEPLHHARVITHRRKLAKVSKLIFILVPEGNEKSPKLENLIVKRSIINGTRVKNEFGVVSSLKLCGLFYGYILAHA
jgi:hypothetical protein